MEERDKLLSDKAEIESAISSLEQKITAEDGFYDKEKLQEKLEMCKKLIAHIEEKLNNLQ